MYAFIARADEKIPLVCVWPHNRPWNDNCDTIIMARTQVSDRSLAPVKRHTKRDNPLRGITCADISTKCTGMGKMGDEG